jgi:type I restriction enzyme S subunit
MGQSPPGETYNEHGDGLPFFQGVADFNYRHPTPRVFCTAPSRIALPGDILLSVRAPIGRVNVADRRSAIGRGLSIIRPRNPEDGRYVEFVLRMLETTWQAIEGSGSVFGNATRKDLETLRVPWPPAGARRAIAHILGTLDDKIELNRRMSETLEAMARALFKAWFVDFGPVRAKMNGRWQRGQSLPGLPAHLYDLFPDRLVDSELGEIPEGWEMVELAQVLDINPARPLQKGQLAPYLDMANMPTRGHVPYQVAERPYTSGTRFINGDTLLARITPCLENGKTAFVDFLTPEQVGWGSTEFIVLRPKPPLPPELGYCLARHPDFREFAIQSMTGTSGRQRVQPEALARYLLIVPWDETAKAFGNLVEPMFRKASQSEHESRTLAALRDALLSRLISGELRTKDAKMFTQNSGVESHDKESNRREPPFD